MSFENQVLFFFSALGAFNGFFMSGYFAFFVKNRNRASYFLSALLLVISIRVTKSVFLIYDPSISSEFVQIGLSACALIGPFLYLYIKESISPGKIRKGMWLLHILPVILIMAYIGYYYPYREYRILWQRAMFWSDPSAGYLGLILYTQWSIYLILAVLQGKALFKKLFRREEKLTDTETWLLSVIAGVGIIWLAYNTVSYTSYIAGAISFSFVLYLMVLFWVLRKRKASSFLDPKIKYAQKKISPQEADLIGQNLEMLFQEKQLYKNPELKLSDLASELQLSPSYLSQYLNDNQQKSFSTYVNEFRVNAAEEMLKTNRLLTLEAIGQACGFNSNSSFYSAFKKFKGITPGKLKKELS